MNLGHFRIRRRLLQLLVAGYMPFILLTGIAATRLDLSMRVAGALIGGWFLSMVIVQAWLGQMQCPRCHARLGIRIPARFCRYCGFDLDSSPIRE